MRIFDLILIFVFISWFGNVLNSQTDSTQIFYDELKKELFPISDKKIYLYEYLGNKCTGNYIDSTILIRAQQPDPPKVVYLLKRIMYSKDQIYFEPLLDLYLKHIENYKTEYWKLYGVPKYSLNNTYPCDPISNQFVIISAFEETLKSLFLAYKKFTPKEIFNFYIREKLIHVEAVFHQKPEFFNNLICFCDRYFELTVPYHSPKLYFNFFPDDPRKNSIDPFDNYMYPYYNELKPFFVEYLLDLDCRVKYKPGISSDSCNVLRYVFKYLMPIKDHRIYKYFIENYEVFLGNNFESIIYEYAGEHYNKDFSEFVADKLLLNSYKWGSHTIGSLFSAYIADERNFKILLEKILLLAETDYKQASKYFSALCLAPGNRVDEFTKDKIELLKKLREDSIIKNK